MFITIRRQHVVGLYLATASVFALSLVLLAAPAAAQGQTGGGHGSSITRATSSESAGQIQNAQGWGRGSPQEPQTCASADAAALASPSYIAAAEDATFGWSNLQPQTLGQAPGMMSWFGYNNPSLLSWWGSNPFATTPGGVALNGCGNYPGQGFFPQN
jgi:hypothetical protein